ncbi:MAG TPA: hypothetical protein PLI97_09580 [Fluviicola sp.]|nr:hypothetical protein [Fluviicola sp.]
MTKEEYTFELEASPFSWFIYSQELYNAGNVLYQNRYLEINSFPNLDSKHGLMNSSYLLFGYSLENVIKGILIAKKPDLINDFRMNLKITKGHDLVNLVKDLNNLTKQDKKILKLLSDIIPNWGRYPVSKDSKMKKTNINQPDEFKNEIDRIWLKLISILYELIKDGNWISPSGIKTGFFRDSTLEKNFDLSVQEINDRGENWRLKHSGNVDLNKTTYF